MINISEVQSQEINEILQDYQEKGGVLKIVVYKMEENDLKQLPQEGYMAHLVVARQTIDKINYQCNFHWNKVAYQNSRGGFPICLTDYDKLDSSGVRLDVEKFLGSFYDLKANKPLIKGRKGNENNNFYFYYDQEEIIENRVDFNRIRSEEQLKEGFESAFLNPPYGLQLGNDIKLIGEYVIKFMDFFFGELDKIQVYTWDTDCSPFFEDGKEWWGCYFWTVYNPIKNWYVGIAASTTD